MRRLARWLSPIAVVVVPWVAVAADISGSQDHALISRYQASEIIRYDTRAFDEFALFTAAAEKSGGRAENAASTQALEGTITQITYRAPAERTSLEVFRNYRQALEEAGFETLFACKNAACGGRNFSHAVITEGNYVVIGESYGDQRYLAARLGRDEGDVYVALFVAMASVGGGASFKRVIAQLDIVEVAPMEAAMVTVDASQMASEIAETGRIALYGIYFDTAKADLKPESRAALDQIAALLAADPALALVVVGHTDNVGSLDYNMALSGRRAEAVARALVADHGIDAGRLLAWGVGYLAPVASNRTEAGRALNRRVELVEQ